MLPQGNCSKHVLSMKIVSKNQMTGKELPRTSQILRYTHPKKTRSDQTAMDEKAVHGSQKG